MFCRARKDFSPVDPSKEVIFNTNEPTNDLEGSLWGHVLFAQNIIIPSKAATDPADHRPHLVSLRDTLVLFKPFDGSNFDVTLSISDKNKQQIFNAIMLPPDTMPRIATQVSDDIDEYEFIERNNYDYVFSSQDKLDLIDDGHEGNYLRNLLATKSFVKIEMANGQWIRDFHLPSMEESDNDILIVFEIHSGWSCFVHYNDKELELQTGSKMAFTFIEGRWDTIYESSIKQKSAVERLIATRNYATVVQGKRQLKEMINDYDGNRINDLIKVAT